MVQERRLQKPAAPARARCAGRYRRSPHVVSRRHRCGARAVRHRRSDPARAAAAACAGLRRSRQSRSPSARRSRVPDRRARDVQRAGTLPLVRTAGDRASADDALARGAACRCAHHRPPHAKPARAAPQRVVGLRLPERRGARCARRRCRRRRTARKRQRYRNAGHVHDRYRRLQRTSPRLVNGQRSGRAAWAGHDAGQPRAPKPGAAALRVELSLSPGRPAARAAQRPARDAHRSSGRRGERARNDGPGRALPARCLARSASVRRRVASHHRSSDRPRADYRSATGRNGSRRHVVQDEYRRRAGAELADRRSADLSRSDRSLRRSSRSRHLRAALHRPHRLRRARSRGRVPKHA